MGYGTCKAGNLAEATLAKSSPQTTVLWLLLISV